MQGAAHLCEEATGRYTLWSGYPHLYRRSSESCTLCMHGGYSELRYALLCGRYRELHAFVWATTHSCMGDYTQWYGGYREQHNCAWGLQGSAHFCIGLQGATHVCLGATGSYTLLRGGYGELHFCMGATDYCMGLKLHVSLCVHAQLYGCDREQNTFVWELHTLVWGLHTVAWGLQ